MKLTHRVQRQIPLCAWILVAVLFLLSLQLSPGYSVNSLYIGAILLGLWAPDATLAMRLAFSATFLVAAQAILRPQIAPLPALLFSRTVLVSTYWVTAFIVKGFRRNQVELRRHEQRSQEYLDIVSVAVLALDANGRMLLLNRRGVELLGLETEPPAGTPWIDTFVDKEDRAAWHKGLAALRAGTSHRGVSHVSRVLRPDGTSRVVTWEHVILRDATGQITGTLSSGEEITARLEAENALRRSIRDRDDIKYALEQSAIIATTDVKGNITYVNDTFCEISKYSREELIGQNHRILNSGWHPTEFFRDLYGTIANGHVWHGEIRNRAKDGSFYWVDTTIVPFVDEQRRPYQYIAIRYDITARKLSEAALLEQSSLAQLGKMAAVVAHEVRNPLAGIRGALQVIGQRLDVTSSERKIMGEIVTRIDTLNDIVQDLLFFARPRQPVLTRVSVWTMLQETTSLLRDDPELQAVDVKVIGADFELRADRELLKMVLHNLLLNGAQAMRGSGVIRVEARDLGAWHELTLTDQGPGILPEVRQHLFEPFFTTKHKGTGLGLATTRRIVEAHGGTIALECPPAGGTVAIIRIPNVAVDIPKTASVA